jgi:hypothetical protein
MSDQDGAPEHGATSRAVAVSDAEELLIYAYISGNRKDVVAAIENLNSAREMSAGQPSPKVIDRLINNDPLNAAKAGLTNAQFKCVCTEAWCVCKPLPANYTLDRQYNQAMADANSESIARAAIQAALNTLIISEWGIFRKTDPSNAIPIENRTFETQEEAQKVLLNSYNNAQYWEVRGRAVGPWKK